MFIARRVVSSMNSFRSAMLIRLLVGTDFSAQALYNYC